MFLLLYKKYKTYKKPGYLLTLFTLKQIIINKCWIIFVCMLNIDRLDINYTKNIKILVGRLNI